MNETPFYELPLAYSPAGLPEAEIVFDLPYLEGDDPVTRLDLYRPGGTAPAEGYPVVLFLHGGPLAAVPELPWPKEWRIFEDYGRLTAAHGLAAAVFNHRYTGYEALVRAAGDALQAAKFLETHHEALGLDMSRLAVWAFSGAGMLLSPFLQGELPGLRALAGFYPMLDLTHVEQARAAYSEEELIALSPLSQLDHMPRSIPLYFVRAGLDQPGLNRALDTFAKQALYHNLPLELRSLPEAHHGFDMFDNSPDVREAIRHGFAFMRQHLRPEHIYDANMRRILLKTGDLL